MTEEYATYQQAVTLKERGFDWECCHYYFRNNGTLRWCYPADDYTQSKEFYSAPRLSYAQKWLREVMKIDVLVWVCACGYGWDISKAGDEQTRGTTLLDYDYNGNDENSGMWLTYEAALSAGIDAALELIKAK